MSPVPDLILEQDCRQTMATELSPQASQAPCPRAPLQSGRFTHAGHVSLSQTAGMQNDEN